MSTAEATTFADNIKTLGDSIVKLNVLEAKALGDYLEVVHGIKPAAAAVAGPPPPPAAAGRGRRAQDRVRRRLEASAPTRSTSSRSSARPPAWASRKPRTWSRPPPRTSRPASPRKTPRSSRRNSKKPARPSRSSDPADAPTVRSGHRSSARSRAATCRHDRAHSLIGAERCFPRRRHRQERNARMTARPGREFATCPGCRPLIRRRSPRGFCGPQCEPRIADVVLSLSRSSDRRSEQRSYQHRRGR